MALAHMSRAGRVNKRGKVLNEDLRRNIIQNVVEKGGDLVTGYFPGSFSEIAQKNRTTCNTAKKTLKQFCETGSTCYESHAAGSKHLQQDDLNFMQLLKISRASMATGEVYRYVNEFCSAAGGTSNATIKRTGASIRNHLTDGGWTWKRLTQPVAEKFRPESVHYCQQFVNYIYTVDPYKLNFLTKVA